MVEFFVDDVDGLEGKRELFRFPGLKREDGFFFREESNQNPGLEPGTRGFIEDSCSVSTKKKF